MRDTWFGDWFQSWWPIQWWQKGSGAPPPPVWLGHHTSFIGTEYQTAGSSADGYHTTDVARYFNTSTSGGYSAKGANA